MPSRFAEIDAEITRASAPITRCTMCLWLMNAGQEDHDFVDGLLRQPIKAKGHVHISRVLGSGGVDISADTIRDHRLAHLDRQFR